MAKNKSQYDSTLNLPKTLFEMRAGLPKKEPVMLKDWDDNDLYNQLMKHNEGKPQFILHDGPPYANGNIHMGTALNKIIKDIIIRDKNMEGYQAPYVPGFDTHGLPIELKAMKDQGFDEDFSAAITGASSCLGPIIPPSTGMVLYAMMAEESVGTLFIAGVLPGIIMAAAMCLIVYITAKRRNYPISPRVTWKERGRALWRAVPALLSPVILLSGILLGIFSATEASVVCCLYSLFLGIFIYKELSPKGLYNVFLDTLKSSGMVMALVTFSMLLATILNYNQIPQAVAAWAVTHITSKVGIILACMVLIIIAGMVIDVTPAMLILIPIMMPVIRQYGINPIAFGVASTLLFSQGLLTPPVGSILYVLADYTKMPVMRIAKNMIPYIITFMVLAFCFMMFPQICTFLPGLIQ